MEIEEWNKAWLLIKMSQVLLLISERNNLLKQQHERKKDFLEDYLLWLNGMNA